MYKNETSRSEQVNNVCLAKIKEITESDELQQILYKAENGSFGGVFMTKKLFSEFTKEFSNFSRKELPAEALIGQKVIILLAGNKIIGIASTK